MARDLSMADYDAVVQDKDLILGGTSPASGCLTLCCLVGLL
jgi:hypothetical protein